MITNGLEIALKKKVFLTKIDPGNIVVQSRKRYYWTTSEVGLPTKKMQKWKDVLDPLRSSSIKSDFDSHISIAKRKNSIVSKSKCSNTVQAVHIKENIYRLKTLSLGGCSRWVQFSHHSDTSSPNSKTIVNHSLLSCILDRRGCEPDTFRLRRYTPRELSRLFTFPDNHAPNDISINKSYTIFGKAVVVKVIEHILKEVL